MTPLPERQSDGAAPCACRLLPQGGRPPPPHRSKTPTPRKLWRTTRGAGDARADALTEATRRSPLLPRPQTAARLARVQPCYWPPAVSLVVLAVLAAVVVVVVVGRRREWGLEVSSAVAVAVVVLAAVGERQPGWGAERRLEWEVEGSEACRR